MRKDLAVAVFLGCVALAVAAAAVDLSPANWPPGELEKYARLSYDYDRPHPRGAGRRGLVVGVAEPLAIRAGLEALKQGGSAADAAIATSLAQVVLSAGCYVSFAGLFSMVYYDAATGEVSYLDGGYNSVANETDPLTIPPRGTPSGRSALVPGFMAAVGEAHQRFGELPWADLFAPSIYFAEEGFRIDALLGSAIAYRHDVLTRLPATRAIFTSPDGDLYQTGEILRQPQLAGTLRRLARRGADDMYEGVWARHFVTAVRDQGGRMTMKDLRSYAATWGDVERLKYRGNVIHLPGSPANGGRFVTSMLKRLRRYDMESLGHYTESATALHHLIKATRDSYVFEEPPPGGHSDGVIAIDEHGNVAAVVHSIVTLLWGTTGIFVDGVSIPDTGSIYQRLIDRFPPGTRLPEPVNPLVVLRHGRPVLASTCIGVDILEATVQAVVNTLDYGLDPKVVVNTPNFRSPADLPPDFPTRVVRGEFEADLLAAVRAMGIPILEEDPASARDFGYWIGAVITPNGRYMGATAEAFNGVALGF